MTKRFEILCATMHQTDFSKLKEMNVHSDIVYANQCNRTAYEELKFDGHTAKMISTQTRGVGKNRNLALLYASADICLLADDDVRYEDDMEEKILTEFANHLDADVMAFNVRCTNPDRHPPIYLKTKKWPRIAGIPWGTYRVAFRLSSMCKANVWFTMLFGGGCLFPAGEDTMWIDAMRKLGLTVYVSKEFIGTVSHKDSTWFDGYNERYYYGVGALHEAINPKISEIRFWYKIFKTRSQKNMSVHEKLKWLRHGKKGYHKMLSYEEYIKDVIDD